jgi:hypothetical protein
VETAELCAGDGFRSRGWVEGALAVPVLGRAALLLPCGSVSDLAAGGLHPCQIGPQLGIGDLGEDQRSESVSVGVVLVISIPWRWRPMGS